MREILYKNLTYVDTKESTQISYLSGICTEFIYGFNKNLKTYFAIRRYYDNIFKPNGYVEFSIEQDDSYISKRFQNLNGVWENKYQDEKDRWVID